MLCSAGFTKSKVVIAGRTGAVYHTAGGCAAPEAGRYNGRVYVIDRNCYTVVKYVAFAIEIFTTRFNAVFDDAAMKLVNILESLRNEVS